MYYNYQTYIVKRPARHCDCIPVTSSVSRVLSSNVVASNDVTSIVVGTKSAL